MKSKLLAMTFVAISAICSTAQAHAQSAAPGTAGSQAIPVLNPFPHVGAPIQPGGVVVVQQPIVIGYTCADWTNLILQINIMSTGFSGIKWNSVGDIYAGIGNAAPGNLGIPGTCASPESACNCITAGAYTAGSCMLACMKGQDNNGLYVYGTTAQQQACAKKCSATFQSAVAWCVSTDGFC